MGTDKSQLLINGESLIQRIANSLSEVTKSVTLVGHNATPHPLKLAADVYPQWGALGGLHGALNACGSEWAIVIACDLPFVTPDLLFRLAQYRENAQAVVPIQPDDRPQPLCALYRVDPCLQTATELIRSGKRRPLDLVDSVRTHWVPFGHVQDLDQSQNFFLNINTPEDYYEATQKASAHTP